MTPYEFAQKIRKELVLSDFPRPVSRPSFELPDVITAAYILNNLVLFVYYRGLLPGAWKIKLAQADYCHYFAQ